MKLRKSIATILSITMLLGGAGNLSFADDSKDLKKIAHDVYTDNSWPDGISWSAKNVLLNYNQLQKNDKDKVLEVFKNLQKKKDAEKAEKTYKENINKLKKFIKGAAQCCVAAGLLASAGILAYYTSSSMVD